MFLEWRNDYIRRALCANFECVCVCCIMYSMWWRSCAWVNCYSAIQPNFKYRLLLLLLWERVWNNRINFHISISHFLCCNTTTENGRSSVHWMNLCIRWNGIVNIQMQCDDARKCGQGISDSQCHSVYMRDGLSIHVTHTHAHAHSHTHTFDYTLKRICVRGTLRRS